MGTKRDTLRQWSGDLLVITLGSIAYALSVSVFSAPNDIAPGGFTGLATLIHYLWNRLPIGITTLALNVPLLIVTRCRMGRGFLMRTLLGLVIAVANPFLGAMYTFFFSNIVGKQVSKAVFSTAIVCAVFYLLDLFGYTVVCISAAALITYIPLALLLLGLGIAMIFLQNGLGGGIMALCGKSPLYGIGWWA